MIALVEGAKRQKTPNEIALSILLAGLTIVFLLAVATLQPFAIYSGGPVSTVVLIALLVCLIPTTIGALLSAIGIAGMDRVTRFNVLAMSGRAVEAAGDVDVLLLDKTGTITYGNRLAAEIIPVGNASADRRAYRRAPIEPGGRDARGPQHPGPGRAAGRPIGGWAGGSSAEVIPFRADTRMSGVRQDGHAYFKGAVDAVARRRSGAAPPPDLGAHVERISQEGGTPLALLMDGHIVGVGLPEGHGQAGHAPALRRVPPHGHPHHHDHRRQPAHRRHDRPRGRRRRLRGARRSPKRRSASSARSRQKGHLVP